MAIIKAVSSRASLGNVIKYVSKTEKTEEKLLSGINCSPQTAIDEMKTTKMMYNKTDKRQYYHFVQSFDPKEKITLDEAHKIAKELAEERFKGYEVLIATHKDTEHIHSHFIVNSVNMDTGYKLHWSKYELAKMKQMSNDICLKYGFSIAEKGQGVSTYSLNKYKPLEKAITKREGGEYKSYVLDCYVAVRKSLEVATSKEEFIKQMAEKGYTTKWQDSRKYITFTDKNGKKIRNSNLTKTFKDDFSKEVLENGFKINHREPNIDERAGRNIERADNKGARTDNRGAIQEIGADAFEGARALFNLFRDEDRTSKETLTDKGIQRKNRDSIRARQADRESGTTRKKSQGYDLER